MRQKFITKCIRFLITNCDSFITKCGSCYKIQTILLQNATDIKNASFITNCNTTSVKLFKFFSYLTFDKRMANAVESDLLF